MTTETKPDLGEAIYRAALVLGVGASAEEFGGLKEHAVHMDEEADRLAHSSDGVAEGLHAIAKAIERAAEPRQFKHSIRGGRAENFSRNDVYAEGET